MQALLSILGRGSYSFEFKLNLVEEAKRTSNREVARNYAIAEACIRDWRKNEQKLILSKAQGGQFRKKGGGRPVRDGQLEKILYDWYSQQIANNVKITGTILRAKAQELSVETGSKQCKFSSGWLENFKKRYGIKFPSSTIAPGKDQIELMERMLYDWLLHQQLNSVNVSEQMAKEKADALCKACSPSPDYKFSIKWFDGFKTHYNINFSDDNTSSQPGTSADLPDVKPFDGVFFHNLPQPPKE